MSARKSGKLWRRARDIELMQYHGRMPELVFEVVQESDGGYCAECLGNHRVLFRSAAA
jgi:hypothetical protein